MGFETWKKGIEKEESSGFGVWKTELPGEVEPSGFEAWKAELPEKVETPKGISFVESVKEEFARPAKGAQYVPGLGGIVGAAENLLYLDASHRLQTNYDYSKPIRPAQAMPGAMGHRPARYAHKKRDAKLIEDLILRTQEQQERGYTFGGKVAKGVLNLPTWMAEFAMTGGLATLGSGAAKKAGTKLMGQWAKTKAGKIALRGAGWTGGAITRATLGLGARVTEKALGRQVNVQILNAEEEGWATSFAKAWGDITIEAASETAGEALTGIPVKLLSKTKFGSKFLKALKKGWMKATGGAAGEFAKKIAAKGGYSNIIGEYGEERLGNLLRALTAVEDFGMGKDAGVVERLMAGAKQDLDPTNIAVEFTVLGAIPGGQVALGLAGQLKHKKIPKASSISDAITKHADMPGVGVIAEHLVRKYGPKKGLTFYDRKIERLADGGKKISNLWDEQTNRGWETPEPDITETRWEDKPTGKTVDVASSGLTSAGTVLGTTVLIENPSPELASKARSKADVMYTRLKSEKVSPDVAAKLAQMAGAWTRVTGEISFDRLLNPDKTAALDALKKDKWKGTQKVAEGISHNLLEYFGYDYRKPQDIPTAVKAIHDHIMEGWFNNLVSDAGGISHAVLHRGVDRDKRPSKPVLPETEASPTSVLYHGTSDISAVQKEGIIGDKTKSGSVSATDDVGFAGKFVDNVVKIVIPSNAQGKILDITIDENEKATIDKGFPWGEFYDPKATNPITRKQQLVGLDALSSEQKKWLTDRGYIGIKFLTTMAGEPSSKVEVRFAKDIPSSWVKERVEPIVSPTVEEITGKTISEIIRSPAVTEVKPAEEQLQRKPYKSQYIAGHEIPKVLKMTEEERQKFMKEKVGKTSMAKMTPGEAQIYIKALHKLAREKGIETGVSPPERVFRKPIIGLTPQLYKAKILGVEFMIKPATVGKQRLDIEFTERAKEIDKMKQVINRLGKETVKTRAAAKLKNKPTKSVARFAELLNKYEEPPVELSKKEKDVFNYFRNLSRSIIARENEVRKELGMKLIEYKPGYMRHIIDTLAQDMTEGRYPIPEEVKYWAEKHASRKIRNPMEFRRKLGDELEDIFSNDLIKATKAMLWTGLKEIHLNKPLKFFENQLGLHSEVIPDSTRRWVEKFINQMIVGKQTATDQQLNDWIKEGGIGKIINKALKLFGRTVSHKPLTNLMAKAGRLQIYGVMGWRPKQLIRNKFQLLQNLALYTMKANLKSYLPASKQLKELMSESLFLKTYKGFEALAEIDVKTLGRLWLKPFQWTAVTNARRAMKVAYHDTMELIQDPRHKRLGWADPKRTYTEEKEFLYPSEKEKLLNEMEFGAGITQYHYIPMAMPGVFNYKIATPLTRLQSWWMNYFFKFQREAANRFFKGETREGLKLPWSRRIGWGRYLIIGGVVLNTLGYTRSFMFGAAPEAVPPIAQLLLSLYTLAITSNERARVSAKRKFLNALKTFIPGYLAKKDISALYDDEKSLKDLFFYSKGPLFGEQPEELWEK